MEAQKKWYDWSWYVRVLFIVWVPWLCVFMGWFVQETAIRFGQLIDWLGRTLSWNLGDVFVYIMIAAAAAPIFLFIGAAAWLEG